jgi:hypothetical protein
MAHVLQIEKVKGHQQAVQFHVDDLMTIHMGPSVNDEFRKWLNNLRKDS